MRRRAWQYFVGFMFRPLRTSEEIASDARALGTGAGWALGFGLAYALVALIYYILGHEPVAQPFLPIPLERWYLVQTFTTVPVSFVAVLTFAGISYILGRAWKGGGSFDAIFASQAFSLTIPFIIWTWIPEMFLAPFLIAAGRTGLPWPAWAETLRIFVIPCGWLFFLSSVSLSRIHKISWWKALIIALVAVVPFAGLMAVFIR